VYASDTLTICVFTVGCIAVALEEGACAATIADMEARAMAVRIRVLSVVRTQSAACTHASAATEVPLAATIVFANARVGNRLSVRSRRFHAITSSFFPSRAPDSAIPCYICVPDPQAR
jgi:hypothetical protein